MRAKRENSSTSRLRPSTSWMIVWVHSVTSCCSSPGARTSRRRSRWAESWIGVSGFLISCAMRCATSRQAASRWAFSSSVRSSKTMTRPPYSPSGPRNVVPEARSETRAPLRRSWSACSTVAARPRWMRWASATTSRRSGPTNAWSMERPTIVCSLSPNIVAAAQVEAEPHEREDDDQGHQQEEQDVDALDGILHELELLVLLERLLDAADLRLQPLGDVSADHDGADHAPVRVAADDGHDGLDEITRAQLPDRGDSLAAQPEPQLALVDVAGRQVGEAGVLHVHQFLATRREDRQGGEAELLLLLDEVRGQRLSPRLTQQAVAVDDAGDVLSVAERGGLEVLVVGLRNGEGLLERPLDLGLEPALDRLVDEVRRDDEDQDGRRQRQRQEGQHQLRLELGSDELLAALEPQLDQVADEQHEQQQEHDQVQVEEREDDDVGGERELGHPHLEVDGGGGGRQDEQRPDDDEVAASPALFGQEGHGANSIRLIGSAGSSGSRTAATFARPCPPSGPRRCSRRSARSRPGRGRR